MSQLEQMFQLFQKMNQKLNTRPTVSEKLNYTITQNGVQKHRLKLVIRGDSIISLPSLRPPQIPNGSKMIALLCHGSSNELTPILPSKLFTLLLLPINYGLEFDSFLDQFCYL